MKRATGFTLIEIMIVVVMVGILASVALPAFLDLVETNRKASQVNRLIGSFIYARSEAVRRKVTLGVCASSDEQNCNNVNWDNGWIVFIDVNNDGAPDAPTDTSVLKVYGAIDANTITSTLPGNAYAFASNGFGSSIGTIKFCDDRGADKARAIVISAIGRVKASKLDEAGAPLTCP